MTRVTYLENSGFAVTTEETLLAFDICSDRPVKGKSGLAGGVLDEKAIEPYKRRILFFSHSHDDHYCDQAIGLKDCEKYISFEFPDGFEGERLHVGQEMEKDGLWIKAFGSTDLGVSFLVKTLGYTIFHAGDFNLWHWRDESTKEEIDEAYQLYEGVMQTLLPYADQIDLCFFPVDPRMGLTTMEGALDMAKRLRPRFTIPMHMQDDEALGHRFEKEMEKLGFKAKCLPKRGDWLDIEDHL